MSVADNTIRSKLASAISNEVGTAAMDALGEIDGGYFQDEKK